MYQQTKPRGILLIMAIAAICSCTTLKQVDTVEYDFAEGVFNRKLVVAVPVGVTSETHHRDSNGVLVRTFHYADGSEFYIACKDHDLKPLISVERGAASMETVKRSVGDEGQGTNTNGTAWRRAVRDCFVVGYDFVDPKKAKEFDYAIHSMKVRKG
jgi:hypothetical protein